MLHALLLLSLLQLLRLLQALLLLLLQALLLLLLLLQALLLLLLVVLTYQQMSCLMCHHSLPVVWINLTELVNKHLHKQTKRQRNQLCKWCKPPGLQH